MGVRSEHFSSWLTSLGLLEQNEFFSDGSLLEYLHNCSVLCHLLNLLRPGLIHKIFDKPSSEEERVGNFRAFLNGCQEIGVNSEEVFTLDDLESEDGKEQVLRTLEILENAANDHGILGSPSLNSPERTLKIETNPTKAAGDSRGMFNCWATKCGKRQSIKLDDMSEFARGGGVRLVKATFPFEGTDEDEICFAKGDILEVTKVVDGGWWEGTLNGKNGWFPSNYVKEISASPEIPVTPTTPIPLPLSATKRDSTRVYHNLKGDGVGSCLYFVMLCFSDELSAFIESKGDGVGSCLYFVMLCFSDELSAFIESEVMSCRHLLRAKVMGDELSAFIESKGAPAPGILTLTTSLSKVVQNILDTERAHVSELQALLQNYLKPLQYSNILSPRDLKVLCGNFEELVRFQQTLFGILDECAHLPLSSQRIGANFLQIAPQMKELYLTYCANHPRAVEVLTKYSDELSAFIESKGAPAPGILTLTTSLSKPFCHLDKYPTLLKELERHLEDGHIDELDTKKAIPVFQNIKTSCNEMRKKKETELEILTGTIEGLDQEEINKLGDVILMAQFLIHGDEGEVRERYFLLFSSCLIILSVSAKLSGFCFERKYDISNISVRSLEDTEGILNAFEIKANGDVMKLSTNHAPEKAAWMETLPELLGQSGVSPTLSDRSPWEVRHGGQAVGTDKPSPPRNEATGSPPGSATLKKSSGTMTGSQVRYTDFQVHYTDFQVHYTDFQVHYTDFQVYYTDFQVYYTDFQVHYTDFQVHYTDFPVRYSDFQVHNTDFQVHNSDFQVHYSDFQVHYTDFQVHHTDFQVHHTYFQIHHTDFQVHYTDFQVHYTDFQVHYTDFQVHHTDFQVHHTDFQVHYTDFQVHHTDFQVHNTDFQVHHTDFQVHHTDFQVHYTDFQVHYTDFQIHYTDFQVTLLVSSIQKIKPTEGITHAVYQAPVDKNYMEQMVSHVIQNGVKEIFNFQVHSTDFQGSDIVRTMSTSHSTEMTAIGSVPSSPQRAKRWDISKLRPTPPLRPAYALMAKEPDTSMGRSVKGLLHATKKKQDFSVMQCFPHDFSTDMTDRDKKG
ncbi:predicted protein [Nematostella vectensis]|uniref:Rho guanine nucleotide exchange factor 7 n=1 Tax=Nematostella vectensis TaxID=45351 RepID=A7SKW6_NEMVE|nr:predicted protein [Nematostella vectensis]|eukprot:XP_001627731.1 predicted protein [Nematostella vectensis]